MSLYVGLAKRFTRPGYKLSPNDITHPPGATVVFSWLYRHDNTMMSMVWFQFVVCALVPLSVALLAWSLFGKQNAKVALAVTSLYFPFIEYGGFFLAEIQMIALIPLSLALLVLAAKRKRMIAVVLVSVVAGLVFSWAVALKALSLVAGATGGFVFLCFWRGAPIKKKAVVAVTLALAVIPVSLWLSERCTTANEGRFCYSNNKNAADVLLGHYGRVQSITWKNPKGGTFTFGNPSDYQHNYTEKPVLNFGMTDSKANADEAKRWIKAHPGQAAVLTLNHVFDMYTTSAWPSAATKEWQIMTVYQYLFIVFVFFPACMRIVDLLRRHGLRALLGSDEAVTLAPFAGLVAAVMISTGEPRYRIPFDSLFIVVAIEFFRRWRRDREPTTVTAESSLAADPGGEAEPLVSAELSDPQVS
jgi:4-amino-4-deoxy-L-arabinose transferase-like glycosyltransferase